MNSDQIRSYLDDAAEGQRWLAALGVADTRQALRNLVAMAEAGLTVDLMADVADQLGEILPKLSDANMALNNLQRFVGASLNPLSMGALFSRDRMALRILLQIFSTSQHLSDLLVSDTGSYDLLRITEGRPIARDVLTEELASEVEHAASAAQAMEMLRRFKRRETLRIAYGDLIRGQRLEVVTKQISVLADAIVEAAVRFARRALEEKHGVPRSPQGEPARFVVLGMGKLGGEELNYSSDIDLICLYDIDGKCDGRRSTTNKEFFERLVRDVVKLLAESTPLGAAYRVDLRLRPEGSQGPVAISFDAAVRYYNAKGRTWERQAYVKARPVAGDVSLGFELLDELEPWIYQRYLGMADITGIKALKRRIEKRSLSDGEALHDVKNGHGGIRDIEFSIQFLQLLNGVDLPQLRIGNTQEAIANLEQVGCLNGQERAILAENYVFLRKTEHLLQIMFDLQTHLLPRDSKELRKLAIRMGYEDGEGSNARTRFAADYEEKTALNRKILNHLLHDAFADDAETDPEVDLVLDPEPPTERIEEVLGRYGFRDIPQAYRNLMELATEKIRFLSTRRCRMFLASIAQRLLTAISERPDPDSTLTNLCKVSDSVGGKGVLWELFSANQPSLELYVELCASSPYLSGILTTNPGMIDGLMDSLLLDKLPNLPSMRRQLADLTQAAEDIDPILHSFKNAQQLRVGVRDILGKEEITATTAALSHVAEACLEVISQQQYARLVERFGQPMTAEGKPCELVILAMGKFGGGELNYHSDLDLIFLFEADGATRPRRLGRKSVETTTNQHFFGELGQRIIKVASHLGPYGKLYEVDSRLRPTGKSGPLAMSLDAFSRYYDGGGAALWERMALCRARVVYGGSDLTSATKKVVAKAMVGERFRAASVDEIRQMRTRLEESAGKFNLKRGVGGLVDIEFAVQALQLRHGKKHPQVLVASTPAALVALNDHQCLSDDDTQYFLKSYALLRTIEARLRLMNSAARDDLPEDEVDRDKLARLVGYKQGSDLLKDYRRSMRENRKRYAKILASL